MTKPTRIAAVGAGRMGRGIALSCAIAGVESLLVDLKSRTADDFARLEAQARAEIERDLEFLARLGVLRSERLPALVSTVAVLPADEAADALSGCELVFEGVPETLEAKRNAFAWIGKVASPQTIVASTTSTMGVNELAAMITRPQRFLNAHWLNPAHLMPLVELSVGSETAPDVTKRVRAILTSLGKVPVVCSASPGYIVPRVQALAMNEAARLVEEGVASAEDVDTAVRVGFGLRFAVLGLLEFIDWGGNDILYYASGHLSRTIDAQRFRAPTIIERNMRSGRNGVREGEGFYDYKDVDVGAYRAERLERFVRLIQHLGLLPPGLE
jgi:3-hydroxybutyryl-CoA dehydrogenase